MKKLTTWVVQPSISEYITRFDQEGQPYPILVNADFQSVLVPIGSDPIVLKLTRRVALLRSDVLSIFPGPRVV